MDKLYIAQPMKHCFLKVFFAVFALLYSFAVVGQSEVSEAEKNDLRFQDYFFEALKQKAILNYSKAVENLEKCAQLKEDNVAVLFELSKNYLLMERYFEAEIFIDKSILKEPNNIDLLRHKVEIYTAQQQFDKAIELQKKVIEDKPIYRTELAQIYIQNEDFDAAEAELQGALNDGHGTVQTGYYLNFLERRKEGLKAGEVQVSNTTSNASDLRAAFKQSSDFSVLKKLLEQDLIDVDYNNLLNDSQMGVELFPAQALVYAMNAKALNGLGKYNDAVVVLSIGEDFIIENSKMQLDFYEAYITAYKGLNNADEVSKYELKIEKLRREFDE